MTNKDEILKALEVYAPVTPDGKRPVVNPKSGITAIVTLINQSQIALLEGVLQAFPPEATEANKSSLVGNWIMSHENGLGFNFAREQVQRLVENELTKLRANTPEEK